MIRHNIKPRKLKKRIIGYKMSKTSLKRLLNSVRIVKYKYESMILPYDFCPNCGCREVEYSGNIVDWPEVWEVNRCLRCGNKVSEADNSFYHHTLEDVVPEKNKWTGLSVI